MRFAGPGNAAYRGNRTASAFVSAAGSAGRGFLWGSTEGRGLKMSNSVVHYEVHVLERGRWHVHARYAREERDRAMNDARATEVSTGHATKVVRDVFYPETGS